MWQQCRGSDFLGSSYTIALAVPAGRSALAAGATQSESRPWQPAAVNARLCPMDTVPRSDDGIPATPSETEPERQARLAWEVEGIAEARADVAAGRLVDAAEVDAWIDSIGTDHELPVPRARR